LLGTTTKPLQLTGLILLDFFPLFPATFPKHEIKM